MDGEHVILADSIEKSGCCLNVGGFAPFAFVKRVKTPVNTLPAGIFYDEPAELSVNYPRIPHPAKGKTVRTRFGHEHTTCLPRLADYAALRSWVRDKAAVAEVN